MLSHNTIDALYRAGFCVIRDDKGEVCIVHRKKGLAKVFSREQKTATIEEVRAHKALVDTVRNIDLQHDAENTRKMQARMETATCKVFHRGMRVLVNNKSGFNQGARGYVEFQEPANGRVWVMREGASAPVYFWPFELEPYSGSIGIGEEQSLDDLVAHCSKELFSDVMKGKFEVGVERVIYNALSWKSRNDLLNEVSRSVESVPVLVDRVEEAPAP